jgi:CheY-like chemotaxis protein
VLIVDDQPANLRLLEDLFIGEGLTQVVGTTDARSALGL